MAGPFDGDVPVLLVPVLLVPVVAVPVVAAPVVAVVVVPLDDVEPMPGQLAAYATPPLPAMTAIDTAAAATLLVSLMGDLLWG